MFGDKRSYCVALITPSEPAVRQFGAGDIAKAAASLDLRAAIEKAVAEVNATLASYETVKSFSILPMDFSEMSGELTPSLKVNRQAQARYRRQQVRVDHRQSIRRVGGPGFVG